jgi:hypothetical protein
MAKIVTDIDCGDRRIRGEQEKMNGRAVKNYCIPKRKFFNCWISPDGGMHEVLAWEHSDFIFGWFSGSDIPSTNSLLEGGWVKIATRHDELKTTVESTKLHPSRKVLDGIYEAYTICQSPEIREWLKDYSYFEES